MILIAVDGGGCHYRMIELGKLSDQYKSGGVVLEAIHRAIGANFKKLKWHKGKMDITITEVDDVQQSEGEAESLSIIRRQGNPKARFLSEDSGLQTFKVTNQPGDKRVQKRAPKRK